MESHGVAQRVVGGRSGLARVAGLDAVTHRLRSTVITPLLVAEMGDDAVTPPTGVVVHGPAGCGKHHITSALAAELKVDLVCVAVSELVSLTLAEPSVVLTEPPTEMDQVDAVQGWFERGDPMAVLTVVVTDRPWTLAPELLARGCFDRMVFVPPPDFAARRRYVIDAVGAAALTPDELEDIVVLLEGGSGADIRAVFERAADAAVGPSTTFDDVVDASSTMVPDARRWLDDARSLVSMTATRGMVDDLVAYLRRNRLI